MNTQGTIRLIRFLLWLMVILPGKSIPLTAQDIPHGLLTDLIAHTDKVYINGYPSTLTLDNIEEAIEPVQYIEIQSSYPSFSWMVPGEENGTYQTAYHIIVSDSREKALKKEGNVWDSGKMESNQSVSIIYGGQALKPQTNYFWRVRVFTNAASEPGWSDIKAFRTASRLSDYASACEMQVKTPEYPQEVLFTKDGARLFDFGKDAFSQLRICLTSETGRDSVQVRLGEFLSGDSVLATVPGSSIRMQEYTIPLMKGTHTYQVKIRKDKRNTGNAAIKMKGHIGEVLPFRYVAVYNYSRPLTRMDVTRESVHVPFDETSAFFHCNNDTLNQIWDLCKYTMKATSFTGIYIDGDRERIPYEADVFINQLGHYCTDRSYAMARHSWEYLLDHPTWPTEWILQGISLAWNDYMYTGDARSLKANYAILKHRTLSALKGSNGLITTTTGLQTPEFSESIRFNGQIRDIVDWPNRPGIFGKGMPGEADGFVFTDYNAVTNAWHYETLKIMAKIAAVTGHEEEIKYFEEEAMKVWKAYNKLFFNKKSGLYCDGDTTRHVSLHTNMFAVDFGLVPSAYISGVNDFIVSRGMACSVYGSQFLMDALYDMGNEQHALSLLTDTSDRSWYNMIRVGSTITLEAWDNKYKPNQDWNHAWGAVPANIIMRRLVGVEPLTAGFETVRIHPQIGSLTQVEARIPTIRGTIKLNISKGDTYKLSLTLPANMKGEVYIPLKEIHVKGKARQAGKIVSKNGCKYLYIPNVLAGTWHFEM